jgi:Bacterial Ig domain
MEPNKYGGFPENHHSKIPIYGSLKETRIIYSGVLRIKNLINNSMSTIILIVGLGVISIVSLSFPPITYGHHNQHQCEQISHYLGACSYNFSTGDRNHTPDNPPTVSNLIVNMSTIKTVKIQLNASDPEKNDTLTLTFYLIDKPLNGRLSNVTGNSVNYTANAGFNGLDKFTYRSKDKDGLNSTNIGTEQVYLTKNYKL